MRTALQAMSLSKRYGRAWGLNNCSMSVPEGKIAALVGPNGAGKTTLLQLAVGLLKPTSGEIMIFDHSTTKDIKALLKQVGFVAQDHPLYRSFAVAEMLNAGRLLNSQWDDAFARARLDQLGIALDKQVGKLSGGQQAQVALVLALAKRPTLLLLDEPLASLDPLARRDFLRLLMTTANEHGTTVLLSSHIISDLERVCDYLIILTNGSARITGDKEEILAEHCFISGTTLDTTSERYSIIEQTVTDQGIKALVKLTLTDQLNEDSRPPDGAQPASLEDIALAYLGQEQH